MRQTRARISHRLKRFSTLHSITRSPFAIDDYLVSECLSLVIRLPTMMHSDMHGLVTYLHTCRPEWHLELATSPESKAETLLIQPLDRPSDALLTVTIDLSGLTVSFGRASRTIYRCEYPTDEITWLVGIELLDAVLGEEAVSVSYQRNGNLLFARLLRVDEFFIQHGHPSMPTHVEIKSWSGGRDARHLIKAMRDIVVCDVHGSIVLRYRAPDGREQLEGATLEAEASMSGGLFVGMNLRGADLYWQGLSGADFSRADLREANLSGTRLSGCRFCEADLRGTDFGPSNLGGGTRLDGADFRGAQLEGAQFALARYTAQTQWPTGFDPAQAGMILVDGHDKPIAPSRKSNKHKKWS